MKLSQSTVALGTVGGSECSLIVLCEEVSDTERQRPGGEVHRWWRP